MSPASLADAIADAPPRSDPVPPTPPAASAPLNPGSKPGPAVMMPVITPVITAPRPLQPLPDKFGVYWTHPDGETLRAWIAQRNAMRPASPPMAPPQIQPVARPSACYINAQGRKVCPNRR